MVEFRFPQTLFTHSLLQLLKEIEISVSDARKIYDAFITIDFDRSGMISCGEFHRYFNWRRGVLTERIFDMYLQQSCSGLKFEEFVVCIWNFTSYDVKMIARWLFNIFDIDRLGRISIDETYALMRFVYCNHKEQTCSNAMAVVSDYCHKQESITLEAFIQLILSDNSIIFPVIDCQTRMTEKIPVSHKKFKSKRRQKFGSEDELVDIKYEGNVIVNSAKLMSRS